MLFLTSLLYGQEEHENDIEQLTSTTNEQLRDPIEQSGLEKNNRFNINKVTKDELSGLLLLAPEEIDAFINHRDRFGNFINMMELQAISNWDITTIRKILPYLFLSTEKDKINVKHSIAAGKHFLLYRTGSKSNSYPTKESWMIKNRHLLNYKFKFKDELLAGVTIEKDAGEKNLLDHHSFYVMIKNKGMLKNCLIGDYNINMGQGLIHWQGYAFGRSSNLISGYRQGQFIQPHTGTDENRFHRGFAIQFKKGRMEIGVFAGRLKIDANTMTDSLSKFTWVSALLLSGLHRNESEKADKNSLTKNTWGGKLKINLYRGTISLNFIRTNFSIPIQKRELPYNMFAISGKTWSNLSLDVALPTKIGFVFGELALDQQHDAALNLGLIKSIDPKLDISFIYRNMSRRYRAFESNCISKNSEAGNESGLLFSFNLTLHTKHTLEGFMDYYENHWPTFTSDRPETGSLGSIQYSWKPNKKTEIVTRYQIESSTANLGHAENHTSKIGKVTNQRWRIHISFTPIENITVRCRNEIVKENQEYKKSGVGQLSYLELIYKPITEPLSISFRYCFFSTDGYSSRIYAYERDLSSYYAIPAHFNQGSRNYLLLQYNFKKILKVQMKIIGEQKKDKNNINNYYQIPFRNKEWRLQFIWDV